MWTGSTPTTVSARLSGQVRQATQAAQTPRPAFGSRALESNLSLSPSSPTGQYCAEDVNECLMQPNACHNGGTCFNTIGSHTCVCVNGWTGDDCSENIDDCTTAMCFNGATCHDRVASFFCECPVGKTGESALCASTHTRASKEQTD